MPPEVVAFPKSTEEVAAVARLCHERRVALTPFGVGTSLEGHIQANSGGVSLAARKSKFRGRFRDELMLFR